MTPDAIKPSTVERREFETTHGERNLRKETYPRRLINYKNQSNLQKFLRGGDLITPRNRIQLSLDAPPAGTPRAGAARVAENRHTNARTHVVRVPCLTVRVRLNCQIKAALCELALFWLFFGPREALTMNMVRGRAENGRCIVNCL